MPPSKLPAWVFPVRAPAVVSRTVPARVSSRLPTGIWRASLSGMKPAVPFAWAALAAPAGSLTNTSPFTGTALAVLASCGLGSGQPSTVSAGTVGHLSSGSSTVSPSVSFGGGGGGSAVSTVKLRLSGVALTLAEALIARTSKLCEPSASAAVVWGEEQVLNAALSTRHWKEDPASVDVKAKAGVESVVGPDGPEMIVVSGGVVSGGPIV